MSLTPRFRKLFPLYLGLLTLFSVSLPHAIAQPGAARCTPGEGGQCYALLVGVSEYPNLSARYRLNGPKHDIELIHGLLRKRGFSEENITVLADGVEGSAALPERAAILAAMSKLANTQPNDFVYLHFSGHGSQQLNQPDDDPEDDNLDEVIVPRDVSAWNDEGAMPNAIVDDELRKAITAIRKNGTFVWAVFDSCQSGTVTRALRTDEQDRIIPLPDAIRARAGETTRGSASLEVATDAEEAGLGKWVAFYAAQSTEPTPELFLPKGNRENKYGLFTYTLRQVLELNPTMTYRQAAQQVLQSYAASNRYLPTPLFEGNGLDTSVFGIRDASKIQQWPLQKSGGKLTINAGQLHQLGEGSILAVLADATQPDEAALGYVEIIKADVLESQLKPVAFNEKPATEPPDHSYIRLIQPQISLALTVARPPDNPKEVYPAEPDRTFTAREQRLLAAVKSVEQQSGQTRQVLINWVAPEEAADVRLLVRDEQLWYLPPSSELDPHDQSKRDLTVSGQADDEALITQIQDNLARSAKASNLIRLVGVLSKTELQEKLVITATIERGQSGDIETFELTQRPELHHNDIVRFNVNNTSNQAIDLTALFINSKFGIDAMYPYLPAGETPRITAGGEIEFGLRVLTHDENTGAVDTVGVEHILFIAQAAKPETFSQGFGFLAQKVVTATRGPVNSLDNLLIDAGFGVPEDEMGTRNAAILSKPTLDQATMKLVSWRTMHTQESE